MPIERPSGACSSSHCPLFVKVGRSDGKKKKKTFKKGKETPIILTSDLLWKTVKPPTYP